MRKCPRCSNTHYQLYGHTYYGKQRYRCIKCHHQYVDNPTRQPISPEDISLINKLLLERLSIAAISRVTGMSVRWIQSYINQLYYRIEKKTNIKNIPSHSLVIQADELCTYVGGKDCKYLVWIAIDCQTNAIVYLYVGDRIRQSCRQFWQSLPTEHQQATCYTDLWEAYVGVIPKSQHIRVTKDSGLTNKIERFNNTIRQRIGRLVRKTLSFSKSPDNLVGALWYFYASL